MTSARGDRRTGRTGRIASARRVAALLASMVLALGASACRDAAATAHPNIVILLADDLGVGDVAWMQCGAADPIATPNLDRLVATGIVLDQFRAAPLCSPARAAMLTARSPVRLGLLRNLGARDVGGLDPDVTTLPQVLRDAGYATRLVGKWHLGRSRAELRPLQRGFDAFLGLLGGWIDYQTHVGGAGADWWRGEAPLVQEGHSTRLLADEAVRVIEQRDRTKPLFLHLAFNAPHAPTSLPPGRSIDEMPGSDPVRRTYALLVDELDRAIGRVLDALESEGLRENTIVVFASDNGAPTAYGGSNGDLRGEKGTVFDGGLRVPAIVSWPGRLDPGRSDEMVNAVDLAPTLCRAAGVAWNADTEQDGVDLWNALRSAAQRTAQPTAQPPVRTTIFGVERPDGVSFAAFDGRWKLVRLAVSDAPLLFDVRADPGETRDLAVQETAIVARLAALLEPWRSRPHSPFVPDDDEAQRGISGDASK